MLITHIAHKHLNRAVYEKGGDGGASKAQAKAQQQAIDLQREQWNTVMNNLKPYAEVGLPALQQLQGLMTLEGQNKAANDFFGSGLYKTQADQARYSSRLMPRPISIIGRLICYGKLVAQSSRNSLMELLITRGWRE